MVEKEDQEPSSITSSPTSNVSTRPTITLPPRPSGESIFNGGGSWLASGLGTGFSPGPMTLVSSFFNESDEYKSFSQLLAGAMYSPAAQQRQGVLHEEGGADMDPRFKQNRPAGLMISPSPGMFTVPPGLSPATLLDSPGFGLFSPGQGSFGMTHQQALAQVTAQAQANNSHMQPQQEYSSSTSVSSLKQFPGFTVNASANHHMPQSVPDSKSDLSITEHQSQPSYVNVDKPADDGYNWRKYGQKQVKGSEFPRSYYKCTFSNCPVKKKVERSLQGQVTEIIYKGQHNHQPPQNNKRGKNGNSDFNKVNEGSSSHLMYKKDQEFSQATAEHLSGTSDSEEVGDGVTGTEEKDEDEPGPKRRNTEVRVSEPAASHRTVTEPRIIVQTTSEVDLLDDGYRWRKYGQKVVKGNPYPRSYYKCTTQGCNVRKHVERAANDPKAVITTYEGKHNHDVPAARTSSHSMANSNAFRQDNAHASTHNTQQPIALLRLKEEQIT